MKSIVFIALFAVLCMGCDRQTPQSVPRKFSKGQIKAYEFEYEGHQYIQFGQNYAVWGVHNPNCKYHIR